MPRSTRLETVEEDPSIVVLKATLRNTFTGICGFTIALLATWGALAVLVPAPNVATSTCLAGATNRPMVDRDLLTGASAMYQVQEVLETTGSRYQSGQVVQTQFFGRMMLLDGEVMFTEHDEAHYHEMLAHVPLAYLPQAKRVLIVGGGDGGTMLRVLKHKNIESVVMVEIDAMVPRLSRTWFPALGEAFDDPRVTLRLEDGAAWVRRQVAALAQGEQCQPDCGPFDVVLVDSTDFGIASPLFEPQFYRAIKHITTNNSIVAFNVDSPSWSPATVSLVSIQISPLFNHSALFQLFQPTYLSGHYSFMMLSDTIHPFRTPIDWSAWQHKKIDTHYYTPDVHVAAFLLPKFVQDILPNKLTLAEYFSTVQAQLGGQKQ